jgi:hypothetical protein
VRAARALVRVRPTPRRAAAGVIAIATLAALQAAVLAAPVELAGGGSGSVRPVAYKIASVAPGRYELSLFYAHRAPRVAQIRLVSIAQGPPIRDAPRSSDLLPTLEVGASRRYMVSLHARRGSYRLQVDGGPPFGFVVAP